MNCLNVAAASAHLPGSGVAKLWRSLLPSSFGTAGSGELYAGLAAKSWSQP
ncbi:MAG: hypothetical protein JXN62_10460 [Bacteroidales bacterium]|nr:hypothetical protein [Bacteroidales bacterium]